MYRSIDSNKTEKYIDSLESLLELYNNSNPSSISLPPNFASNYKSTRPKNMKKLHKYNNTFIKIKSRFEIGDIVRIKLLPKIPF